MIACPLVGTSTMNASSAATLFGEVNVPRAPTPPIRLSGLIQQFESSAELLNADVVLPVRELSMSEAGTIIVPSRGSFAMSAWARKQLATRVGVVFDRWFEGIDPRLRAGEINRRLARDPGMVRIKSSTAGANGSSDGTLRGFVSPSYATIEDHLVAEALLEELGPSDPEVLRQAVTDCTTTYVVQVGAPLHLTGPAHVGEVRGGVMVRNSDVGFASLLISAHLTRCVCSNGMVVTEDTTILHRAHRRIDMTALREKLAGGLKGLPARIARAGRDLERAGHHPVSNVEEALVEILRLARLPLRHLGVMLDAYRHEPHSSVLGVTQAVTLGAQHPSMSSEDRHALEHAAGVYLRRFSQR